MIRTEVRKAFYLDSVALMRAARSIAELPGIEDAGMMIGTPANKDILREAGLLDEAGVKAGPGDLVIVVRARNPAAAAAAMTEARRLLDQPRRGEDGDTSWQPRTLRAAMRQMPDANFALISVPGDFAAAEARKALRRGLNVMIFSDNVPLAQEAALKREAHDRGLLVMGPDCGTAIIGGVPLAFANSLPRGDVGIIGASGTGIQEVSCLVANGGRGISHAIGTGGRDLSVEIGGITTLTALDLLDNDPTTQHIVLISKPPAPQVTKHVLARVAKSSKPFTVCLLGDRPQTEPLANVRFVDTLAEAAEAVLGREIGIYRGALPKSTNAKLIRGLFCGGTLCGEAQLILQRSGLDVASNVPIRGTGRLYSKGDAHILVDLGDDRFTRGRPHPMIEPATRDALLGEALVDKTVGVIMLDIILGWGIHPDPAGHLVRALKDRSEARPAIVASVIGTEADPQVRSSQVRKLTDAGIIVATSNANAAEIALQCVR